MNHKIHGSAKDAPTPTQQTPDRSLRRYLTRSFSSSAFLSSQLSEPNTYLIGSVIVCGIYVSFLLFGWIQEHIYATTYYTGEKFKYSCFLVFVQCMGNTVITFLLLEARSDSWGNSRRMLRTFFVDNTMLVEMTKIALTYSTAMLTTNYALTHVNFPTQVLIKSAKLVPVVIGGLVLYGKRYPIHDYFAVASITVSLIMFNFFRDTSSTQYGEQSAIGLVCLAISLLCDGMTGPRQDKLISKNKNLDPVTMMFLTNAISSVWTFVISIIVEGNLPVRFIVENTEICYYLGILVICSAVGQLFIFQSLKLFGSLYTSLFTTLRKGTSTLLSVYFFNHTLTPLQWVSVGTLFSTLFIQSYCNHLIKRRRVIKTG